MSSGQSRKLLATRWSIVFGIGIAVTIVAVTVRHNMHGASAPATDKAAVVDAPEAAASQTPASRGQVVSTRVAGASAGPGVDVRAVAAAISARRSAKRREASARIARMREAAAARYEKEARDPAWAFAQARARAKIEDELSKAGVDSPADLATWCKRTVCRTTATFETTSQADEWVLLYMASLGSIAKNSVVSHSQDAKGVIHLDIYSISER